MRSSSSDRRRAIVPLAVDPHYDRLDPALGTPHLAGRILEVGCSDGWRLERARERFPSAEVFGVEPGEAACVVAREKRGLPNIECGTADSFRFAEPFDVILAPFVFHWVDRADLLRSVANLDSHLVPGGLLIVQDFHTPGFRRNRYEHLRDEDVWTYKQDYSRIFVEPGIYPSLFHSIHDYDHFESGDFQSHPPVAPDNAAMIAVLEKTLDARYST